MKRLVLDASAALAVCLKEAEGEEIARVLANPDLQIIVGPHWRLETANAVLMGERRGRLSASEASGCLEFLEDLQPTELQNQPKMEDVYEIAKEDSLTIYDAVYLALALQESAPLLTLDKDLRRSAAGRQVPLA